MIQLSTVQIKTPEFILFVKYAIGMVVVALALCLLNRIVGQEHRSYSKEFILHVQKTVQYACQYAVKGQQSSNLILTLMHYNEALSYLVFLKKFLTVTEIEKMTKINIDILENDLEKRQLSTIQTIHALYPQLQPEGIYTPNTGWI